MKFEKWAGDFKKECDKALKNWQDIHGIKIRPTNFGEKVLEQYIAYRNETMTKKLVIATWSLAIATIILSIITLWINNS